MLYTGRRPDNPVIQMPERLIPDYGGDVAEVVDDVTAIEAELETAADDIATIAEALSDLSVRMDGASGWGAYQHGGAPQAILADSDTVLTNDKATAIETQLPAGIATLFAGGEVLGREGDALLLSIELRFTPDDGTASFIDVWLDIGGVIGAIYRARFPVTDGAGMARRVLHTIGPYTLDTWEANGAAIKVRSNGPGVIDSKRVVVQLTHRGRP